MHAPHTIVIGGGLAGLTAAATLAKAGRPVVLLEGAEHLGGRARTRRRDGFDLNLGPHALYRTAGGRKVLAELGVRTAGRMPKLHRAAFMTGDGIVSGLSHLRRGVGERGRLLRALTGLAGAEAERWAGRPAEEWIDSAVADPADRAVLASILRTATYTADHARARRRRGDPPAAPRHPRGAVPPRRVVLAGRGPGRRGARRRRADPHAGHRGRRRARHPSAVGPPHRWHDDRRRRRRPRRQQPAPRPVAARWTRRVGRRAGHVRQPCPCAWPTSTSPCARCPSGGWPTCSASTCRST